MLKDDVGTVLARTAYHEVAAGFGAEGIVVKTTAEVPDALGRARAAAKAGKPVLSTFGSAAATSARARFRCEVAHPRAG